MILKDKNKQMGTKDHRDLDKAKRQKRNRIIVGIVAGVFVISLLSGVVYQTGLFGKKDSKREIETVKKEENKKTKEDEVKKKLEELKKMDISKLSEVDRKETEEKIKSVENMINKKEYDKVKSIMDTLKVNIDNKLKELDKAEENKTASNNSSSEETSNNEASSNATVNEVSNNSNVDTQAEYSESKVVEEKTQNTEPVKVQEPTNTTPVPNPEPSVEESKPVYPSVGEVKQRLISYGQSLGLTYDSSLESNGFELQGTDQMWSNQLGYSDVWLLNGVKAEEYSRFGIVVNDLGNGFCSMGVYVSYDE